MPLKRGGEEIAAQRIISDLEHLDIKTPGTVLLDQII